MTEQTAFSAFQIPFTRLDQRSRRLIVTLVIILLGTGWGYLVYMKWAMDNMYWVDMWMPPQGGAMVWSVYDFWMLFFMWVMMMTAMMLPSAIPMISLYGTVQKHKMQKGEVSVPVSFFILAYIAAWGVYSLVITFFQWYLHSSGLLDPMMNSRSYLFSGIILLIAGVYQWTPLKNVCLRYCRSPLSFLLSSWKDGWYGAFQMGFQHGLYCVGCCWALMLILFAVGVMNMLWVIILAMFAILEKTLLPPSVARAVTGILLVVWGGWWTLV